MEERYYNGCLFLENSGQVTGENLQKILRISTIVAMDIALRVVSLGGLSAATY